MPSNRNKLSRRGCWWRRAARLVLLAVGVAASAPAGPDDGVIDVWYGPVQRFGHLGNVQRWVNILGNASDPDGIDSLTYTLNGGAEQSLGVGPDTRRLQRAGDFNVEIDRADLVAGDNTVVIALTDSLGNRTETTVTVTFDDAAVWPEAATVDWTGVTRIEDVAQVVDGKWTVEADGVRPVELGYDRLIGIGDITWDNYEVTVPITIHGIDPNGFNWPSVAPGLGVLLRWKGHSVWGTWQPNIGYLPEGGTIWYDWGDNGGRLKLFGDDGLSIADQSGRKLDFDVPYIFKIRAETHPGEGTLYSAKVWAASDSEPVDWDFSGMDGPSDLPDGSMLLVAHHVDATFGTVTVTPLPDPSPLAITNVQTETGQTWATIAWETTTPADTRIAWGLTTAYDAGSLSDPNLTTQHSVTLNGLVPNTQYYIRIDATDADQNDAQHEDGFRTRAPDLSGIVSDDFHGPALHTDVWTLVDPAGDATLAMSGTQVVLSVPAGATHAPWIDGNGAARLMQPAADVDFEIEAKFETPLTERYQLEGMIVEQDPNNYLRVEFHSDGTGVKLYVASFADGVPTTQKYQSVPNGPPLYMRVHRASNDWTVSYSTNGAALSWVNLSSFEVPLAVTAVGVYAGNDSDSAEEPAPAQTAVIDYFFNTASVIDPEDDGLVSVTALTSGDGSVMRDPNQAGYNPGDVVTLTATPGTDAAFAGWTGDMVSNDNPLTITVADDLLVTATFTSTVDTTPPAISNVEVAVGPDSAEVTWLTDEPADSAVAFGTTVGYELGTVSDPTLTTQHSVTLGGLSEWTAYHFQVGSTDAAGNGATTADDVFTTSGADLSGIRSDDFFSDTLDPNIWTFVDPVGDASYAMSGTQLELTVPVGVEHGIWTGGNHAARVMQACADENFEVEVKFESPVNLRYQQQGLVVEQDPNNFLRLEFYSDGGTTWVFAARLADGTPTIHVNQAVPGGPQSYMRLRRSGDTWTQSYSFDGQSWQTAGTFVEPLVVSGVGIYAANSADPGETPPAHTAVVDYFFNTASPVTPEDGYALAVSGSGGGTVTVTPDQEQYSQGQNVDLSAQAASGWVFDSWTGDVTATDNPLTVTMLQNLSITAVFVPADTTPPAISNVQVSPDVDFAVISWDTDEPARAAVSWGPTSVYESGTLDDPNFATHHSVTLTGLAPATTVHYRITATDAADNASSTADATFDTLPPQYTLTVAVTGSGDVVADPNQATYTAGSAVTLDAVAGAGWQFDHWEGDLAGSDNPATLVMDADKSIVAVFVASDCPGDVNHDGQVDLGDVSILLAYYGTVSGAVYEDGDLDGDGDVDLADLSILLSAFGQSC